ncbi:cyclic nucleotide-binding domain protein (macronuclear) [Tetrahymena thermophila SB210]|uniref:Cyclic nucleotide-binding domain protein n=1 Tax=Tetrahymena thermophila (strain SB210) TaxID=312017 RepID=I7ML05_TETTS|nr:cyclic nucleotide-binding domain protein [Tetrahymena thermophila SB210]EAS00807.2 cyclic nucleotide-binding domain protein [Tetrahymena thermophila SB210]|eukprot:XP_001021052.2 cyclic nucleotide-binding domain protein [Tetrahymena thermophila SB210]
MSKKAKNQEYNIERQLQELWFNLDYSNNSQIKKNAIFDTTTINKDSIVGLDNHSLSKSLDMLPKQASFQKNNLINQPTEQLRGDEDDDQIFSPIYVENKVVLNKASKLSFDIKPPHKNSRQTSTSNPSKNDESQSYQMNNDRLDINNINLLPSYRKTSQLNDTEVNQTNREDSYTTNNMQIFLKINNNKENTQRSQVNLKQWQSSNFSQAALNISPKGKEQEGVSLNHNWKRGAFSILQKIAQFRKIMLVKSDSKKFKKLKATDFAIIGDKASDFKYYVYKGFLESQRPTKIQKCVYQTTKIIKNFFSSVFEKLSLSILKPDSNFKVLWDILMLLLIWINLIICPLIFSFDEFEIQDKMLLFMVFTCFAFATDIIVQINTAFFHQGIIQTSRQQIIAKYFKQSMIPDIVTFFCYVRGVFTGDKYLLLAILLKTIKEIKIQSSLQEVFQPTEKFMLAIRVFNVFQLVFIIAHFASCIFNWVASIQYDGKQQDDLPYVETWLSANHLIGADWYKIYINGFYFSMISMMTIGYGDITPKSINEKIYTIFFCVVSCASFAYSINTISQVITDAKKKSKNFKERMRSLNLLMQNRQIDNHLQMKVRKYIEYLQETSENMDYAYKDLEVLPTSIKQDVQIDMYGNLIKKQKLFYLNFSQETIEKLALAVNEISAGPGEVIYKPNDSPDSLYIVLSGRIEIYIQSQKINGVENETNIAYIEKGCVFGAEEFFNQKPRQNAAKATELSQIIQIQRNQLEQVLKSSEDDYEHFKMLSDMVKYSNTTRGLGIQCHFCKNFTHSFSECPNVTYSKRKNLIIMKLNISQDQQRDYYPRKHIKSKNSLLYQNFLVKSIKLFIDLKKYETKDTENQDGMISGASEQFDDAAVEDNELNQIITEYTQKLRNTQKTEEESEISYDDAQQKYNETNIAQKLNQKPEQVSMLYAEQFLSNNNNNSGDEKDNKKGNSRTSNTNKQSEEVLSSPNINSQIPNSLTFIQNNSPTFNQNVNQEDNSCSQLQTFQLSTNPQLQVPQQFPERERHSSIQRMYPGEIKLFPLFSNTPQETRITRQTSIDFTIQNQLSNLYPQKQSTNNFNSDFKNSNYASDFKNSKSSSLAQNYTQQLQSQQSNIINTNSQNSQNLGFQSMHQQQQPLSPQLVSEIQKQKQIIQDASLMKLNTVTSNINTLGGKLDSKPTQNLGSQLTSFENMKMGSQSFVQLSFNTKLGTDAKGVQSINGKEIVSSVNQNLIQQETKMLNQQQSQNQMILDNSIEIHSIREIKGLNNWESETLKRFDRFKIFKKYFPLQNINKILEVLNQRKNSKGSPSNKKQRKKLTMLKKYDILLKSFHASEFSPRKSILSKNLNLTNQNSEYLKRIIPSNSKFESQKDD